MMAHRNPGAVVWLWAAVLAAFATIAMTQTTLIPDIPASQEDSPLVNLWRHALRKQKSPSGQVLRSEEPAPETYMAPEFIEVVNWVPQDSAHPLYVDKYYDLLREILLDYMVTVKVQPGDPRMSQPNGLQVTNLNGKTLTFTKDAEGIKINGVPVIESKANSDGTISYIVSESLFGHRERVQEAWEEYIRTVPQQNPFGGPIGAPVPPPPPAP